MNRLLNKKERTAKYVLYCAVIAAAALLQNVAGLFFEINGARCFFIIPVTIILIIGEDELQAAILGLLAGLLWDMNSAVHMGFNCLFLMIICFFISAAVIYIARSTFATSMIFVCAATVLYCFLYWLFFIIIKNVNGASGTLITFYIPCAVYTIIISPLLYLILNPLKKKLNHVLD